MKISLLDSNINVKKPCNMLFGSSDPIKNDSSNQEDEYVKVPKSEYNSNKWIARIFWALLAFEVICVLLTRKTEFWEDFYKGLKKK